MKFKFLGALAFSLAMFGVLGVAGSGLSTAHAQTPDDIGSNEWNGGHEDHHGEVTLIEDSFVIIIDCGEFAPCFIFDMGGGFPLDGVAAGGAADDTEVAGSATEGGSDVIVDGDDGADTESGTDVSDGDDGMSSEGAEAESDSVEETTDEAETQDAEGSVVADDSGSGERPWTRNGPR